MSCDRMVLDLNGLKKLIDDLAIQPQSVSAERLNNLTAVVDRLETAISRDDLTGLFRRKSFFSKFEEWLSDGVDLGENISLLILDIDFFKSINDRFGHSVGDQVIQAVSQTLKQFEGPEGFAGRLGGEEFALVLRGTPEDVRAKAEWLRAKVERLSGTSETGTWTCTISIGIAHAVNQLVSSQELYESADAALYQAKKCGRNRVLEAA